MEKQKKKMLAVINYMILAALYLITIQVGYGEVRESLDGCYGFSGNDALRFVVICILLTGGCLSIVGSLLSDRKRYTVQTGKILMMLPCIFHFVVAVLRGNAANDFQYLMLKIFQGFEYTHIVLIMFAMIGYMILTDENGRDVLP